ncbi:hypothetical protein MD588_24955 [Photobacterium sp. SDRW27]|uniref:hypothetical protein n=1 Tax=Photobacterium obscurum TaxID=2829490 RepID=UPI0022444C54|nr:hypothetical protein [Photobacterium obscurum]MCW8332046.1 hypothetical protein [Photobacterium obscurum]
MRGVVTWWLKISEPEDAGMVSQGGFMLLFFSPDRHLWPKPLCGFGGEAIEQVSASNT